MIVTRDMIAPELHMAGKVMGFLSPSNRTEEYIRNHKPAGFLRIMSAIKPRGLNIAHRTTTRPDGSEMDLYVVTSVASTSRKRTGILSIHGGGYSGGNAKRI